MPPTAPRPALLVVHPAFLLGSLIALYFLLGRWTFARLQGDFDQLPLYEQPRVWVIGAIAVLSGLIYFTLYERGLTELRQIDFAIIAWLSYMLISSLWAPDSQLASEKAMEVVMLLVVALSIAMIRSPATEGKALLGFWYALVAIGAAMGLLALYMSAGGRVFTPTGGPNIFGRNMGLVGVGALMLATRNVAVAQLSLYVVVVLSAMWVVMCGSRGALLATGLAGFVLLLTSKTRIATKFLAVVSFSLASLVVFLNTEAGRNAIDVFRLRILQQTVEQRYTADRDDLFSEAVELGLARPFTGWGLSGFRANSWTYPHNLFLEAFSEGGIVGLSLLLWIFWIWWRTLRRNPQAKTGTNLATMALMVTAACFSGNFYDSRGVFLFLALSIDPLTSPVPIRTDPSATVVSHARRHAVAHASCAS